MDFSDTFSKKVLRPTDAFVVIDYDHTFLYVNEQAEKFYRKSKELIVGRKIYDVFPEQWNKGPFRQVMANVEKRASSRLNYKSPFANAWVELIGEPSDDHYSFTYRLVDYQEILKSELREEVKKKF